MRSFSEFRPPAAAATVYLVFDVSPSDNRSSGPARRSHVRRAGGPAGIDAGVRRQAAARRPVAVRLRHPGRRLAGAGAAGPAGHRYSALRGRFSPSDDAGCKGYAGSPVDAAAMGVGAQLAAGPGVWPARAVPRAVPVALTAFMIAAPRLWP
jgi:hypothetical protein